MHVALVQYEVEVLKQGLISGKPSMHNLAWRIPFQPLLHAFQDKHI